MTRGDGNQLRLLVLDEPTASLPQAEVDNLFAAVRRLRDGGTAVVFVSHRLDEVFAVADRVTVIRDGRVVDERPVRDFDQSTLIEQILGRTVDLEHREERRQEEAQGAPILRVTGLSGERLVELDLEARAGEIVGVTGLTGSGREELAALLFGAKRSSAGVIEVRGQAVKQITPWRAEDLGMALVPAAATRVGGLSRRDRVREHQCGGAGVAATPLLDHRPRKGEVRRTELDGEAEGEATLARGVHPQLERRQPAEGHSSALAATTPLRDHPR